MTVPDGQPEFDPATWTPDTPWPKGCYKPVSGFVAAIERVDRASGSDAGESPGFRRFFWFLVTMPLQLVGIFAAAGNHLQYGLAHRGAIAVTPVPLVLLFTLALPTLLHVGIVASRGARLRRRFAHGLASSVAMLALLFFMVIGRSLLGALFQWVFRLLS